MGEAHHERTGDALQFPTCAASIFLWNNCEQTPFSQSMRALLQRVSSASVTIDGETASSIGAGFVVLLGITNGDEPADIEWLCGKIARMRVFEDGDGKMNSSVLDTGGEILVVSQFTLHASTKKGNRPSFLDAAAPAISKPLYDHFCRAMAAGLGKAIACGVFGADMKVSLTNDGPVTIWLDSRNRE
jgi:D-aminoacyl-tRNA deacylase